jgi:tRNA modification GTPase
VERSHRSLQQADLAVVVVDGSQPLGVEDARVATLVEGRAAVVAINKSDLAQANDYHVLLPDAPHLTISASTGAGLPALEETLVRLVLGGTVSWSDAPLVSSPRHQTLIERALDHVVETQKALVEGWPEDMLAIDLRDAVLALGEITGESASEDLLASIFSQFCIGK